MPRIRRSVVRVILLASFGLLVRWYLYSSPSSLSVSSAHFSSYPEIQEHNVLELVTRGDKTLNVRKHNFLQVRMGRDERGDLLDDVIRKGVNDFWERSQKP